MSLNCNEINVILDELNLAGAFIQDIIQPGYDTLALYAYKEGTAKTIIICAGHDATRINETKRRIPKNEKPLRFMEFLKSKIRGAKILSCGQIGLERVIKFELGHGDERFNMFVRLWSGAANIILCDQENNILDTMFRRPQKRRSHRRNLRRDGRLGNRAAKKGRRRPLSCPRLCRRPRRNPSKASRLGSPFVQPKGRLVLQRAFVKPFKGRSLGKSKGLA